MKGDDSKLHTEEKELARSGFLWTHLCYGASLDVMLKRQ